MSEIKRALVPTVFTEPFPDEMIIMGLNREQRQILASAKLGPQAIESADPSFYSTIQQSLPVYER